MAAAEWSPEEDAILLDMVDLPSPAVWASCYLKATIEAEVVRMTAIEEVKKNWIQSAGCERRLPA